MKMIKLMEEAGILSRRSSPFESPCFLKQKPTGEWRLFVNYQEVNQKIEKNNDRVPRLNDFGHRYET